MKTMRNVLNTVSVLTSMSHLGLYGNEANWKEKSQTILLGILTKRYKERLVHAWSKQATFIW